MFNLRPTSCMCSRADVKVACYNGIMSRFDVTVLDTLIRILGFSYMLFSLLVSLLL